MAFEEQNFHGMLRVEIMDWDPGKKHDTMGYVSEDRAAGAPFGSAGLWHDGIGSCREESTPRVSKRVEICPTPHRHFEAAK